MPAISKIGSIVTILMAGLLLPVAAVAQEWKTYTYPDPGFTIQFPGVPSVESSRIKNATGESLPMTRYVVRQDRVIYTLSVVNYSGTNDDALSTIAETERSIGALGKVTAPTGARINRTFGRKLSVDGTDGSRSAIAIFFVNKHLYTLVGQALPPNAIENSGDTIRFEQSLRFPEETGGFGLFFGRGRGDADAGAGDGGSGGASGVSGGISAGGAAGVSGGVSGGGRPKNSYHPPADAICAGKSAGDAVQLETPGGPVPATCTLVARPNTPSDGPPNGPADGPPGTQKPEGRPNAVPAH